MNRRSFIQATSSAAICWCAAIPARGQSASPNPEALLRKFAAQLPPEQRRCATVAPATTDFRRMLGRAAHVREAGLVLEARVPIVVHVVHDGPRNRISQDRIDRQIAVLNADFAASRISFGLKAVRFHDNGRWARQVPTAFAARLGLPDLETEMKQAICEAPLETLNLYVVEPAIDQILGWARFPWDLAIRPRQDGVVVSHITLPGNPQNASQLGRTATHEVGHWLGLLHTFQNGCDDPGDGISDTLARARPSNQCTAAPGLCGPAGQAPNEAPNFMDYVNDACDAQFTPGQIERMRTMIQLFRPRLIAHTSQPAGDAGRGGATHLNAIIGK